MKAVNDFKAELETAIAGLPVNYSTVATEIVVQARGDVYPVDSIEAVTDVRDGKVRVMININPAQAR